MYTLGKRIKEARINAGMTQPQLAEKLGVSYQAVSSWENDVCAPDTWNLIETARVLDVSLSSLVEEKGDYRFSVKENLYDTEHMKSFVKMAIKNRNLKNASNAFNLAVKAHEGQFRKNSDIPYIYHPLNMACHLMAMDIYDDEIIAACLLHDVVEDCGVSAEELPVNEETKELVKLLTHGEENKENRETDRNKYYQEIAKNPKAALIKCVDRCNNLTTMSWGLSRKGIYRYIEETEKYILPLLKKTVKPCLEYNNAAWLLSYQMESMLDIYKRLL